MIRVPAGARAAGRAERVRDRPGERRAERVRDRPGERRAERVRDRPGERRGGGTPRPAAGDIARHGTGTGYEEAARDSVSAGRPLVVAGRDAGQVTTPGTAVSCW
ncbi:hypothetical protein [Streptomyces sp. WG7]|uniref:hypothetical protein n=1 Tax=Streptomyces sp. WG7 TaxID=3417650 RepID=UPI003CE83355